MVRRVCIALILLLGLFAVRMDAQAALEKELTVRGQSAEVEQWLSAGATGTPVMTCTMSAVFAMGGVGLSGKTLTMSVKNATGGQIIGDSGIILGGLNGANQSTTNAHGRVCFTITGSGTALHESVRRVYAEWRNPVTNNIEAQNYWYVLLRNHLPFPPLPTPGIKRWPTGAFTYHDMGMLKMTNISAQARSEWAANPEAAISWTYVVNPANAQVKYQEVKLDSVEWLGYFDTNGGQTPTTIKYNMHYMDGDWGVDLSEAAPRAYPPFAQQQVPLPVATHEMGHFIGLGHNDAFEIALMAPRVGMSYWTWGYDVPAPPDWATVCYHY